MRLFRTRGDLVAKARRKRRRQLKKWRINEICSINQAMNEPICVGTKDAVVARWFRVRGFVVYQPTARNYYTIRCR